MCSPVRCRTCQKTTWSGCGMHADEVLSGVPAEQRCDCASTPARDARDVLSGLPLRR